MQGVDLLRRIAWTSYSDWLLVPGEEKRPEFILSTLEREMFSASVRRTCLSICPPRRPGTCHPSIFLSRGPQGSTL